MSWLTLEDPRAPGTWIRVAWHRAADGQVTLALHGEAYNLEPATLAAALPTTAAPASPPRAEVGPARPGPLAGLGRPSVAAAALGPAGHDLATVVRAPTAGRVSAVKVAEGQKVAEDEVVLVLEAMKVEVAVRAPQAGVVGRLTCAQGSWVEAQEALMGLA